VYASLSRLDLLKRFFSNAGWYGASIVLTRAGWLVLLPIYWQALTPRDFGIIGIAQLLQTLLIPVLTLGLADAAQRLYLEWQEGERSRNLFTLLAGVVLAAALICAALDLAGAALFGALFRQVPFDPYFRIAIWTALLGAASQIPLAVLRVQERILAFSVITVSSFLLQAASGVYLVVFREWGPAGYLAGSLAGACAAALLSVAAVARNLRWGFAPRCLRGSLGYGLPAALALLIESLSQALDRFFLDKHIALAQIGLYNLANQFGSAFNVFNLALKTSWIPFLYRAAAERKDTPDVLGQFAVLYLALLALPGLAVAFLAEDFIEFFGGERYRGVYAYVPAFVLYYFVWATLAAMGRGMDLAKNTTLWPLVPTAGLVVTLTALSLLVPVYGVAGALVAILLGVIARALVQIGLSLHYYPRPLYLGRLTSVIGIAVAVFFTGYWLAPQAVLASVTFKVVLLAACAPVLLWVGAGRPSWQRTLALVRSRQNGI
jgi:O-antigen/teichoic acid export membrane protein